MKSITFRSDKLILARKSFILNGVGKIVCLTISISIKLATQLKLSILFVFGLLVSKEFRKDYALFCVYLSECRFLIIS